MFMKFIIKKIEDVQVIKIADSRNGRRALYLTFLKSFYGQQMSPILANLRDKDLAFNLFNFTTGLYTV